MNIILATGRPDLDDTIKELLKNVNVVGEITYRKGVIDLVELKKPNVIIMSDLLDGEEIKMKDLLLTLRLRCPLVRIIYLLKEENPRDRAFLYHWSIFDVLSSSFTIRDLENLLNNPKQFADVHEEMIALEKYKKQIDVEEPGEGFGTIDTEGYHSPFEKHAQNAHHLKQEIVAFWSVLEQAGKTFSSANTALALANNPNLQVLLLDFNIKNPNINFYFNFKDPDRNLSALIEDLGEDELTKEILDDYLVEHPVFPNLKILPGFILRREEPNDEILTKLLPAIINIAIKSNYSSILVDLEAGFKAPYNVEILKQATKILLHIAENPGSYYALTRMFDNLYGAFAKNLIEHNKLIPIITHSYDETYSNFKLQVEKLLETRVLVTFDYSEVIRICSFESS